MTKETVTVLSIRPNSELLNTKPYWGDPKGNTYINQGIVDEMRAKIERLVFPCEMKDTGEKDIFKLRIIIDEFGAKWSEGHFVIAADREKNTPPVVPQGDPVAWIHRYKTGAEQINTAPPETYVGWTHTPLYTTPLSVEAAHTFNENCECVVCMNHYTDMAKAVAGAIEATKEKTEKIVKKTPMSNWFREDCIAAIRAMK